MMIIENTSFVTCRQGKGPRSGSGSGGAKAEAGKVNPRTRLCEDGGGRAKLTSSSSR